MQQDEGSQPPGESDTSGTINPVPISSIAHVVVPGPTVTPPFPADTVLEAPEVEADLVRPTRAPSSEPLTTALSRAHTLPSHPSNDFVPSAADYFSPKSVLRQAKVGKDTSRQHASPPPIPRDPKQFIEDTRNELYGSSATIEGAAHPSITSSGQPPRLINTQGSGEAHQSQRRMSLRTGPIRSISEHPTYPNQALSALQHQVHYPRISPRLSQLQLRDPASASSQPSLFNPTAALSSASPNYGNTKPWTSQTTPSSPAQTPSLFPPFNVHQTRFAALNNEGLVDGASEHSSYPSSPYLHAFSTQPPRTVTSADRQVDTFSGRKMINHYEIRQEIGRGVHGKVKLARDLDSGAEVAIKVVQRYSKRWRLGKPGAPEDKVKKEVAILKKVQHPNVVRLIEVIDDPDIAKVYLVLEYCEKKDIKWRKPGNNEIVLAEHWRQAAERNGDPLEVQQRQFKNLEDMVRRKARREARRRRKERQARIADAEADLHTWSLEYGDDSGDESYSASESGAPEPSTATNLVHERSLKLQTQHKTDTPTASGRSQVLSPTELSPTSTDITQHRPSISFLDNDSKTTEAIFGTFEDPSIEGYSFYGVEKILEQETDLSNPSIEETRAHRQPSIAESIASRITQEVENEVPDDSRYVPTMTIAECLSAFRQALVGLDYLHYHGIIHRDIKPENLLRTKDQIKISDFGVSYLGRPVREGDDSGDVSEAEGNQFEEETELAKTVGTPAFYAPELCTLDIDATTPTVTKQIDVWALGITLFCLLFARTPFDAENEFVLMKRIWTEEVFIPRFRLRAVDSTARSPGPDGALFSMEKRLPSQWLHEAIDDDLYDLLTRLFKKSPKERISIKEIKHHPWVLKDIADPSAWLEDTDPARLESGKKIEISSEEVAEAVVPINLVQRLKSITKRATSALGLGGRRHRGQSSATSTSSDAGSCSTPTESVDKERRRSSLQTGDAIFSAFKTTKDHEHPLSRSVTNSPGPDLTQEETGINESTGAESANGASVNFETTESHATPPARPRMPDRQVSELSTTGSIRTIKASEIERSRKSSASPSPEETSRPILETPIPTSLAAVFGGAGRTILKSFGGHDEASLPSSSSPPSSSSSPRVTDPLHPSYGEPSVAMSNTEASGHLDRLPYFRDVVRGRPTGSSTLLRLASEASLSEGSGTMDSSPGPAGTSTPETSGRRSRQPQSPADFGGGMSRGSRNYMARAGEPTDEEYHKAIDDLSRRRVLQDLQDQELLNASHSSSSISQQPCPPSPDDESPQRHHNSESSSQGYFNSPFSTTFSSDDHFTSEASPSTSYPSIPSMISAASSSIPEPESNDLLKTDGSASSEGTYTGTPASPQPFVQDLPAPATVVEQVEDAYGNRDESYAVETDEDDSSDSEAEFLHLGRKKNPASEPKESSSHRNVFGAGRGQGSKSASRKEAADRLADQHPAKAGRSGSTNTMKKVDDE